MLIAPDWSPDAGWCLSTLRRKLRRLTVELNAASAFKASFSTLGFKRLRSTLMLVSELVGGDAACREIRKDAEQSRVVRRGTTSAGKGMCW